MTEGSIVRRLTAFTVPLILSGLFQQIFNWVDAFIVGNTEGELALAGIGATAAVYNLFVAVLVGAGSGIAVLTGQHYGGGEKDKLHSILSSFAILLGVLFLAISMAGVLLVDGILTLLQTPDSIYAIGKSYLQIVLLGVPFLAVYNTFGAVLRGMGDSRAPFLSVAVSSILNVLLDVYLVVILRRGAAGAALATAVSQMMMTVFIVIYAFKKYPILKTVSDESHFCLSTIRENIRFVLPPAIQSGVSSVGNLVLQRFMNGFGQHTVAAITTAYRVDTVILLPIVNFGSGIATFVAQNIGAGNGERAKKALKVGSLMMAATSLCLTGVVLIFGRDLIAMFGLTEESVEIGKTFFHSIAGFYILFGQAMALRGYIEGHGDMLFSGIVGILSLGIRIAASYLWAPFFGKMVIAYAEAFSWFMLLLILWIRSRKYDVKPDAKCDRI